MTWAEMRSGSAWKEVGKGSTNADGRVEEPLPRGSKAPSGVYRLTFEVAGYSPGGFYPEITVTFELADPAQHYHVPLLLSPYGYSTYRGS